MRNTPTSTPDQTARLRLTVRGAVQGVGFRPFAYRLAADLNLAGWVQNTGQGVVIEVEGRVEDAARYLALLRGDGPPRAAIHSLEPVYLDPVGLGPFEIRDSASQGAIRALILPDIATCADCRRDVSDPGDRRFRYPFTNCTNCGPRFSIVESLPYDRPNTSMRAFVMCPRCRAEYDDPGDRRFHAQPNACPDCGPQLAWWDAAGTLHERADAALGAAVAAVHAGAVVAIKGLGGFHLVADASNSDALRRLRRAKAREEKPFAVMYPSLERLRADAEVCELEAQLLRSPESPIVLVRRRPQDGLSREVAPGNPCVGAMLPYTPLHLLLLADIDRPVVATSGNRADEPICIDEGEALQRLGGIADWFLVHDRPIVRHVDDSLARVVAGRELVLRRARGYAPLPIRPGIASLPVAPSAGVALGAHLKSAAALVGDGQIFISQHIGDLETPEARNALERVTADLMGLYDLAPAEVTCDLHPDYASSHLARVLADRAGARLSSVQHHAAHVYSCLAENDLQPPALGVAWDGTGYGGDGTVWGGEFIAIDRGGQWRRVASLRPFRLPGGEAAVREPRRCALGLLYEIFGEGALDLTHLAPVASFSAAERRTLGRMLASGLNSPITTSAGRLFDGVAALLGLRQQAGYEGQAAMELEFAGQSGEASPPLDLPLEARATAGGAPRMVDWSPMVRELADGIAATRAPAAARRFHDALVEAIVAVARAIGLAAVALSGGCFQNAYLTEAAIGRLREEGFRPYWHQRVPPNDGGIALGQIAAQAWGATRAVAGGSGPQ